MQTRNKQPQHSPSHHNLKTRTMRQRDHHILEEELPRKKIKKCPPQSHDTPNSLQYCLIPFLPEVVLTAEQMNLDSLEILQQLEKKYSRFGAVKVVTPADWNPPFRMKYSQIGFTTRIQPLRNLKLGKAFEEKKEAYSLQSFKQMADEFQRRYTYKFPQRGKAQNDKLQNEYWSLVNGPSEAELQANPKKYKITVEYAADLPVKKYGSGFSSHNLNKSTVSAYSYGQSLWNLNNLYKSEHSLLKISDEHEQHIGGVTIPWLYMGMQFATFCWHIEDCQINSLNYSHLGADKIWYFIPQGYKSKFDGFVERKYGSKNAMSKITYMIDPRQVMAEGIPVYKTYQKAREYVCTFFGAYHCGFSCGFNVGEAVNFVVGDSLPYIKELSIIKNASLFCYEWIISKNYHHGVKKQVQKEYRRIVEQEYEDVRGVMECGMVKEYEMVAEKVKYDKYVCRGCKKYLYLSFLFCRKCEVSCCFNDGSECCLKPSYCLMVRSWSQQRKKVELLIRNKLK